MRRDRGKGLLRPTRHNQPEMPASETPAARSAESLPFFLEQARLRDHLASANVTIAKARRTYGSRWREAADPQRRPRSLDRQGRQARALDLVMTASEIDGLALPQARNDRETFVHQAGARGAANAKAGEFLWSIADADAEIEAAA